MANANIEELAQRLEHLDEVERQMTELVEDFMASEEEVNNAQEALNAIAKERLEIKAMQAKGEVFADGCEPEKQFADEAGNTVVDNGQGYMEPDITSQSCEPGPTADKDQQKEVKKRGSKDKEVKSESEKSSTTPGYNRKEIPGGEVFVVGPSAPKHGYPQMPDYANLLKFAMSRGMKEKDFKGLWENMQELVVSDELMAGAKPEDIHQVTKMKAYEGVLVYTTPISEVKELAQEDGRESLALKEAAEKILAEHFTHKVDVTPERVKTAIKKAVESAGKGADLNAIKHCLHIEAAIANEALAAFPHGDLEVYADNLLSVSDRVERIKAQAKALIEKEERLVQAAQDYINPTLIPIVEKEIAKTGKKVKYLDLLTGRLQLKTYGSKFKITSAETLKNYFSTLSTELLTKLGVERVVSYKYDQKDICDKVSGNSCAFPMSAFGSSEEYTALYVQSPKKEK